MTRMHRIEKGVPISPFYLERYKKYAKMRTSNNSSRTSKLKLTGNGKTVYPFEKMEIGDSFKLPLKKVRNPLRINGGHSDTNFPYEVRSHANAYGHHLKRTFLVLKDDNHQWRCWRTE